MIARATTVSRSVKPRSSGCRRARSLTASLDGRRVIVLLLASADWGSVLRSPATGALRDGVYIGEHGAAPLDGRRVAGDLGQAEVRPAPGLADEQELLPRVD